MTRTDTRVWWGVLLIALGILFLLQSLGIVPADLALLWVAIFGLAGGIFFYVYARGRQNWWAIIPAFTLFGLAAVILLSEFVPGAGTWAGAVFLGAIGLSFWVIYATNPAYWWAIIPGGTLVTLAAIVILTPFIVGTAVGAVLFFGLGLTFVLVAVTPTPGGRMRWAWIPAAVLLVMGVIVLTATAPLVGYIWPAALILAGLYLLLRSSRRRVS